jgi:hypothetical protein
MNAGQFLPATFGIYAGTVFDSTMVVLLLAKVESFFS